MEQLKDDLIAHYHICCSLLSLCTPASKWDETALCKAPFHFCLVLLVFPFLKRIQRSLQASLTIRVYFLISLTPRTPISFCPYYLLSMNPISLPIMMHKPFHPGSWVHPDQSMMASLFSFYLSCISPVIFWLVSLALI